MDAEKKWALREAVSAAIHDAQHVDPYTTAFTVFEADHIADAVLARLPELLVEVIEHLGLRDLMVAVDSTCSHVAFRRMLSKNDIDALTDISRRRDSIAENARREYAEDLTNRHADPSGSQRADLAQYAADLIGWADVLAALADQPTPNAAGIVARIAEQATDPAELIVDLRDACVEWLAAPSCEHFDSPTRADINDGCRPCELCAIEERSIAASEYAKENPT